MAKRKKRAKVQPKKRAKPRGRRAAVRAKARKVSKSARGKAVKPMVAGVKPQRAARKKAVRKKEQGMKPPGPEVETVVVDVIEEPAPGVITVTEIEDTQIPAGRDEREERSHLDTRNGNQRSISPNTTSREPSIAGTSASMCPQSQEIHCRQVWV